MKTTYFIADLHLSELEPHITELFLQFMAEKAPLAEAVYILGDLFDYWIGDDEQSDLITQVKHAIRSVTERGVPCYFIHGNRDFLIGKRFADETGIQLLPSHHLIDLYGFKTLICHGDTFCVDDMKYQKFRKKVHQKWRQKLFLALPLKWRMAIAQKMRAKSQAEKSQKSPEMMDVNPEFIQSMLGSIKTDWVIHGHTHKQAVYIEDAYIRIVLGDWGEKASILEVNEEGFQFYGQEDLEND